MRRLLHVAMTRARKGLVLAWPRPARRRHAAPVALLRGGARGARRRGGGARGGAVRPGRGAPLHLPHACATSCSTPSPAWAAAWARCASTPTWTWTRRWSRYLELIKVAALIERDARRPDARRRAARDQRDAAQAPRPSSASILDAVGAGRLAARRRARPRRRAGGGETAPSPSLEPFIPRRGEGLMLSASDIETYRICPLKYKFARVFRDPAGADDPPALRHRRPPGAGALPHAAAAARSSALMELFEASWRRSGFGDSDDELQFRERAVDGARALLGAGPRRARPSRSGSSAASPSSSARTSLRGRVDRVDRHPDGRYELIDYKTGKAKTAAAAARGRPALALPDGRARVVEARDLGAELLLRADGERVPGRALERGARPRSGHGGGDRRRNPQAGLRADAVARDLHASATTGSSARRRRSRCVGAVLARSTISLRSSPAIGKGHNPVALRCAPEVTPWTPSARSGWGSSRP